jgi:hypothetical protein
MKGDQMLEPTDVARVRAIYDAKVEVVTESGERYTRPAHLLFERSDVKCLLDELTRLRRGLSGAVIPGRPPKPREMIQPGALLSLNDAREMQLCRICCKPVKPECLELAHGEEYAHAACLQAAGLPATYRVRPKPSPPPAVVVENGKETRKEQT